MHVHALSLCLWGTGALSGPATPELGCACLRAHMAGLDNAPDSSAVCCVCLSAAYPEELLVARATVSDIKRRVVTLKLQCQAVERKEVRIQCLTILRFPVKRPLSTSCGTVTYVVDLCILIYKNAISTLLFAVDCDRWQCRHYATKGRKVTTTYVRAVSCSD